MGRERLLKEENARIEAMERESNKPLTKKDKKAVLFDYLGVKRLNAETVVERPGEMRMLRELINATSDFKNFRVPDASKAASYNCPWGAREDGMLLVGIHRHGYGAWVPIRDDEELGLKDKFFLEEHRVDKKEERIKGEEKAAKAPGAVHLVRRADYLLSVLKAKYSDNQAAKRAVENHHRNNKKERINGHKRSDTRGSVSASPAPAGKKARQPETSRNREKERDRSHSHSHIHNDRDRDHRRSVSPGFKGVKRKPEDRHHGERPSKHHRKSDGGQAKPSRSNDTELLLKLVFRPISSNLETIQNATKKNEPSQKARARTMKAQLKIIGEFIEKATQEDETFKNLNAELWYAHRY